MPKAIPKGLALRTAGLRASLEDAAADVRRLKLLRGMARSTDDESLLTSAATMKGIFRTRSK
jgi:hypothetical protein